MTKGQHYQNPPDLKRICVL